MRCGQRTTRTRTKQHRINETGDVSSVIHESFAQKMGIVDIKRRAPALTADEASGISARAEQRSAPGRQGAATRTWMATVLLSACRTTPSTTSASCRWTNSSAISSSCDRRIQDLHRSLGPGAVRQGGPWPINCFDFISFAQYSRYPRDRRSRSVFGAAGDVGDGGRSGSYRVVSGQGQAGLPALLAAIRQMTKVRRGAVRDHVPVSSDVVVVNL
ncbi:hypothetical protein ACHAW5_010966 [Stephanodiscus triporus]|uniref:Uncharacterized protein n=1 Tax=Stephanodiscus triporus TaxID=2934178 RepID=A0ABD3Q9D6_9STRA